ncbi:MAG: glycosyltransferase family 2 protein [Aurantibacter sp.]
MKISVCMATYNGEQYLRSQLDSILKQLSPEDELIISDDGSTDATIDIIKSYRDPRIRLLHSPHQNLIFNFENALKEASGDVVFLSDQDDIWFDDKMEKYNRHFKKNLLVFSNAAMFYGEDTSTFELFFKDSKKKTGLLNNLAKVKFLGATLAFQRFVLDKALPFPRNIPMHDIWIGLIAETLGATHYIDEPLIYYRRHENVASTTGAKSSNTLFTKLRIRTNLAISLCKRMWFTKT